MPVNRHRHNRVDFQWNSGPHVPRKTEVFVHVPLNLQQQTVALKLVAQIGFDPGACNAGCACPCAQACGLTAPPPSWIVQNADVNVPHQVEEIIRVLVIFQQHFEAWKMVKLMVKVTAPIAA